MTSPSTIQKCFHHLAPSDFLPETPNAAPRASPHFQLNSILTWPPPTPKCSEPARCFRQCQVAQVFVGVLRENVVEKPRKMNIEPKHVGLEDDFLFSIGWFFGFHVNFQGFFEEQNLVAFVYSRIAWSEVTGMNALMNSGHLQYHNV